MEAAPDEEEEEEEEEEKEEEGVAVLPCGTLLLCAPIPSGNSQSSSWGPFELFSLPVPSAREAKLDTPPRTGARCLACVS